MLLGVGPPVLSSDGRSCAPGLRRHGKGLHSGLFRGPPAAALNPGPLGL